MSADETAYGCRPGFVNADFEDDVALDPRGLRHWWIVRRGFLYEMLCSFIGRNTLRRCLAKCGDG
jgi:hypothetical protein